MQPHQYVSGRDALSLVLRAQRALGFTQQEVADAIGSSLRTVQRWSSASSQPTAGHMCKLAVLVHPRDPKLAAELAERVGQTLETLGVVAPPAPRADAAAAARPQSVLDALVSSVVAAAAEALDVSPRLARPALVAALRQARTVGVGLDEILSVLQGAARSVRTNPTRRDASP